MSPSSEYSGLICFRIDWFYLLAIQGTLKSLLQHHNLKASILFWLAFFMVQLSYPYMTAGKTIALTIWTFVSKVMSLLFNMLFRFVIAFLPKSKHLLISWLQSPSAVILEPKRVNSVTVSTFPPCVCHEMIYQYRIHLISGERQMGTEWSVYLINLSMMDSCSSPPVLPLKINSILWRPSPALTDYILWCIWGSCPGSTSILQAVTCGPCFLRVLRMRIAAFWPPVFRGPRCQQVADSVRPSHLTALLVGMRHHCACLCTLSRSVMYASRPPHGL